MKSNVAVLTLNDFYVVINPLHGGWFAVNETGKIIVEAILNDQNASQVVEQFYQAYGIPKKVIEEDINSTYDVIRKNIERITDYVTVDSQNTSTIEENGVTIHITDFCNLNCPYCYRDATHNEKNELSVDTIVQAICEFIKWGYHDFVISGGEPTLHSQFENLLVELLRIKQENITFTLITNGTTQLDEKVVKLASECFSSIQISLDSCKEVINQKTRGVGSLQKVTDFLELLNNVGYQNKYILVTPYELHGSGYSTELELPELCRYAIKHGAQGIKVNQLRPNGRFTKEKFKKINEDNYWKGVDSLYEEFQKQYNNNGVGKLTEFNVAVTGDMNSILVRGNECNHCGMGVSTLAIDQYGDVYPCTSLMEKEFVMGNILTDTVEEIVRYGEKTYANKTVDNIETCKDCELRKLCGGGCRALAYYESKNLYAKAPNCASYKKRMEKWFERSFYVTPLRDGE